ncbi:hypothetical protein PV08_10100 [Exophiala spinifera]|uniref:Enoyl reductase (ER) domain-containing protein n=1 Tax=Exophiala spinifera TaxID=91928 RepID=A0A0D1Y7B1_9EURO|nr:uncharacterized protein PV08_10100 [Exophiala spinifera]KIW10801.1 hypothetical protein PV08_10100 [Exophiala spinifera]
MTTQTALALTKIGQPLTKIVLPKPDNANGKDLLIKVAAVGLAPLDAKLRDAGYFGIGNRLPAVIGGDLVGTVLKAGPEVSNDFPLGSTVFAQCNFKDPKAGGLQEVTTINGEYAAIVPPNLSAADAALYPINAMTSANAIFTPAGFNFPFPGTPDSEGFDYQSQKIVVVGGGSNTGKLAIQLAHIAGVGKIIAIASQSNETLLRSYGATHVINRHDPDIESQVRLLTGDDLVHVLDTVNNPDRGLAMSLLSNTKPGLLITLTPGRSSDSLHAQKKAGVEEKQILGFPHVYPEFGHLFWKTFPRWLESGKVKPIKYNVIKGLDADLVNAALDKYTSGNGGDRYHVSI